MQRNRQPARLPSIINRVISIIGFQPDNPDLAPPPVRSSGRQYATRIKARRRVDYSRQIYQDRRAQQRAIIIADCRVMVDVDTRARRLVSKQATDAMGNGIELKVKTKGETGRKAQELGDDLIRRLGLSKRMARMIRRALVDGDLFLSIDWEVKDNQMRIYNVYYMSPLLTTRNTNARDQFEDPRKAYWFGTKTDQDVGNQDKGEWFAAVGMIQARWDLDEGKKYGRPLYSTARDAYVYMRDGERDVATRRRIRAGITFVHKIGGKDSSNDYQGDEGDIEKYQTDNEEALNNRISAITDFYVNRNVDITKLEGDGANLQNIGDIEHHQQVFAVASPVPLAMIGFNRNINRDVLQDMMNAYYDSADDTAEWFVEEIVNPLLELEWLVNDILPERIEYTVQTSPRRPIDSGQETAVIKNAQTLDMITGNPIVATYLAGRIRTMDEQELLKVFNANATGLPDETARIASILSQPVVPPEDDEEGDEDGESDPDEEQE